MEKEQKKEEMKKEKDNDGGRRRGRRRRRRRRRTQRTQQLQTNLKKKFSVCSEKKPRWKISKHKKRMWYLRKDDWQEHQPQLSLHQPTVLLVKETQNSLQLNTQHDQQSHFCEIQTVENQIYSVRRRWGRGEWGENHSQKTLWSLFV